MVTGIGNQIGGLTYEWSTSNGAIVDYSSGLLVPMLELINYTVADGDSCTLIEIMVGPITIVAGGGTIKDAALNNS